MAISITTAYPGEFLDRVLTKATLQNELVQKNLIHVEPNVLKKLYIGELTVGTLLQHRIEQPDSSDAQGTFTYVEKYLEPQDLMAYTEFNPRNFESIWRRWQPNGPMAMETWSVSAQAEFLEVFAKKIAEELGNQYINGIRVAGDNNKLINGIVPRILADKDVLDGGITSGDTTYAKKFKRMLSKLPKALRGKGNLKFITSIADTDNYDEELKLNTYKNGDLTIQQTLAYNGIPVVGLAQWPEGLIVLTLADSSLESNLFAAVAWNQDETFIQEDKVSAAGEKHFLKMLMKADTNIAFGDYVVIYDGREATALAGGSTVTPVAYKSVVNYTTTLNADATWSFANTNAVIGSCVTIKNAQSGNYKITIASVDIVKGAEATFYFDGTNWNVKA
ncbi:MAG: hypothetical protein VZQ98_02940 [Bacteroidales bacterium]|nr:hypothetical protein [Bacteroidales bacterium]